MAVRGAWRAVVVVAPGGGGGAAAEPAPEEVGGSYAIDRIVDDPEFAGGIGPLSPMLGADDGGSGGGAGVCGGGSPGVSVLERLRSRAPALADTVKAAVHAGLDKAAAGAGTAGTA
jgi:hypothetical protein